MDPLNGMPPETHYRLLSPTFDIGTLLSVWADENGTSFIMRLCSPWRSSTCGMKRSSALGYGPASASECPRKCSKHPMEGSTKQDREVFRSKPLLIAIEIPASPLGPIHFYQTSIVISRPRSRTRHFHDRSFGQSTVDGARDI